MFQALILKRCSCITTQRFASLKNTLIKTSQTYLHTSRAIWWSACRQNVSTAKPATISTLLLKRFQSSVVKQDVPIKTSQNVWRLLTLAHPERKRIAGAICLLFISSSVSMSVPFFMGKLIDIIFSDTSSGHDAMLNNLRTLCFTLSIIFLGGACANVGRIYLMQTSGQRIIQRLRQTTFRSVLSQEIAFYDKEKSGELITRLSTDTSLIGRAITDNVSDGLRACVQAIGGVSLMVYTCPKLAGISLVVVPPIVLMAMVYGRYVRKITKQVQDTLAQSSQVAEERFSNIRTVRSFGQEEKEMENYNSKINEVFYLARKESLARAAFYGYNGLTGNMLALMVLYSGGCMMIESQITVGDLTSFLLYTVYVGMSIAGLGSFYTELMRGIGASSRIWQLLDKPPAIPLTGGKNIFEGSVENSIVFTGVHFRYPSRPDAHILHDFNVKVNTGDICAIVGESGSGKSTVASLLLRHYDVDDGTISIGGQDITCLDPTYLRKYIGTVSQEPTLFSTTISENISYGVNGHVTSEEIVDAVKQANAYNFISQFPDGFETLVGEKGQMLSGGQRQRIAIARAILKKPKILLLDEATSALDAESEYLVQDALLKLMVGRTTIIIAHRLSTIKSANQIAVLQNGRIAEMGSYEQLLSIPNGLFRQLVDRQSFDQ